MIVWCHIPTIFSRRYALRFAGLVMISVVFVTTLIFAHVPVSAQSTNKVINFQGRLLTPAGAVVPDGNYNVQFKIYQGGAGTAVNNPGGTLAWTETYANNNAGAGITVKNGFFSVSLGSVNPFGSSVNWDHDTLWLSMNVAGQDNACTTFGSAPCVADGEMLPMKRITATPYAINAGAIGGKTAENFVQLAQGVQIDASTNTSSIFINKTGSGNLIQLQSTATDVFTLTHSGNIELGSNDDKSITIATSEADAEGGGLLIAAGGGGSGDGATGGDLVLQGGAAGGTNGSGGNVSIDAGEKTGSGEGGTIAIGAANASAITIGGNTVGSSTDVTVGAGENTESGTTTLQAKDSVVIATDGTTRATFSENTNTVYFGNGVSAANPNDFTIQGTDSSANAVAGGSLIVQGGNATTGDANGGNVILAGGTGSGNGAAGLVVLSTPTFSTVTNDPNCYSGGVLATSSCTIAKSSVDNAAAVLIGFSVTGQTATLPDPTITTAGRIMYIMTSGSSQELTLSANEGALQTTMRQSAALTMIWNGSDWVIAGGSGSTTLQDAYDSTPQSAGGSELVLGNTDTTDGLTIKNSSENPVTGSLIEVRDSSEDSLFSVNNTITDGTEHAADGTVNDGVNFTDHWSAIGGASIARIITDGQESNDSAEVVAGTNSDAGIRNGLAITPQTETRYKVSTYVKLVSGSSFEDFTIRYSPDNGLTFVDCEEYDTQTIPSGAWTQVTCYLTTSATNATDPYVYLVQPTTPDNARTYLIDTLSFTLAVNSTANVKIGGNNNTAPTLLTVDRNDGAPTGISHEALLGSMYYDTEKGKLQCYEASGWGSCGASPDNFVTLSPEYPNAVMNGSTDGAMTSDICSDSLNINDGSGGQPTVCSTNETYNFYRWNSDETSEQTRSIYVTYQLPATFKEFVPGSTSLMGRTDHADAKVTYQVYRNDSSDGLVDCGATVSVATGPQSVWQKATATGSSDPSTCGFQPGDSIVIRISLSSQNDTNAYVSNLGFTFSNN